MRQYNRPDEAAMLRVLEAAGPEREYRVGPVMV